MQNRKSAKESIAIQIFIHELAFIVSVGFALTFHGIEVGMLTCVKQMCQNAG